MSSTPTIIAPVAASKPSSSSRTRSLVVSLLVALPLLASLFVWSRPGSVVVIPTTTASSSVGVGGSSNNKNVGIMSNSADDIPQSFPALVGMNGEAAKAELESKYPSLSVQVLPQNSMVTMDFRMDRVRVFVDDDGNVSREPRLG